MAIIPKFFFDAVVAIGIKKDNEMKCIGTGFLVGRPDTKPNSYTIFLVTNYHIIENKVSIVARFNQKGIDNYKDYDIPLTESDEIVYSKHPTADIVAIQISPSVLNDNNSVYSWFSLDKHALKVNEMKSTDVIEGCIVYSLGFPINMVGANKKNPICRIGCISRISDLFEDPKLSEYLIDLQAIPGNSGAPIVNRPESSFIQGTTHNNSSNLIGIICGTIDYSEACGNGDCIRTHEKSSGFAIVHPVDSIEETVELEYNRKKDLHEY